MYSTVFDVVIHNHCVVACNVSSYEQALLIRQLWLNCYPDLIVSVCPHLITSNGGDCFVKKTI